MRKIPAAPTTDARPQFDFCSVDEYGYRTVPMITTFFPDPAKHETKSYLQMTRHYKICLWHRDFSLLLRASNQAGHVDGFDSMMQHVGGA